MSPGPIGRDGAVVVVAPGFADADPVCRADPTVVAVADGITGVASSVGDPSVASGTVGASIVVVVVVAGSPAAATRWDAIGPPLEATISPTTVATAAAATTAPRPFRPTPFSRTGAAERLTRSRSLRIYPRIGRADPQRTQG